ncbi:MAG TPA: TonB-dependent receptor [Sphingomicrobium sp.]|nr:TonB-dependent receptor [Sphingomicrobium sp.]
MRLLSTASRLSISASVIALGAAWASPVLAQPATPAAAAPAAPVPESCQNIADAAAKQACANAAAAQVDPNANQGELATSPTRGGAANAQSTEGKTAAIVVTGSRLHRDERTSSDPVSVIDPNVQNREGKLNTAEILQTSPLAQGSTQITSAISTNFVVNGGEGSEQIDLRGLGPNRTLVLLNGRRAGPAGVRGGVSAFDLNVIPEDAIQSVEILKTGASSVYGSDAIAGVVNLITKKDQRGLQLRGFSNWPTHGAGEEYSISGIYGLGLGDRGHLMVSGNYYKRNALTRGDRSFLGCETENVTNAQGQRVDPVNPNTGKPYCGTFLNDVLLLTDFARNGGIGGSSTTNLLGPPVPTASGGLTRRPITAIQYNRPGENLDQYLGGILADPANPYQFGAADGFFPVGAFNATGLALENHYDSALNQDSIIPETKRYTFYTEGGYDLTDNVNLYFEGLYNRRQTNTVAHRQLFFNQFTGYAPTKYTNAYGIYLPYFFCDRQANPNCVAAQGDPFNKQFSGEQLIEPVITAPFNSSTDVKYLRGVAGVHADLSHLLPNGFADFYFQHSRSDGDYSRDIIYRDAIEFGVAEFRTQSCAGTVTAIRGVPCIDINYTDPRVLAGNFTPAERAFLFGVDKGNTVYKQDTAEASFGGDAFKLPYGAFKFALGAQWRRDSIRDVPGEAVDPKLMDNIWGSTTSGITAGYETTKELFGEVEVPLLKDLPAVQDLTLNGAARLTSTYAQRDDGAHQANNGNWTYKIAGNYSPTNFMRLRATYGTSFRSPALFEEFLANESGFIGQGVDPCINYGLSDNAEIAAHCASQGIPADYNGAGSSIQSFSGGGVGHLQPETSRALTLSAIFTPAAWLWRDAQFSFAVDYINIDVKNQITQLGAQNIINGCYTSNSFPNDPLCSLFTRAPAGAPNEFNILTVSDPYLNINEQLNRSLDFTTRFRQSFGSWGTLSLLGQMTYQLKDKYTLFQGVTTTNNGRAGDPRWVGDLNISWTKAPVTVTYGLNIISKTNNFHDLQDVGGSALNANDCLGTASAYALRGGPYCPVYKLPRVAYHSISAEVQVTHDMSFLVGVSNLFDKKPPLVSTVGSPISAFGQVPTLGSYYDYFGRRVFVSIRAALPNL